MKKQGKGGMVASTVGEKRQYLEGATSIHNHPIGGTFSAIDLRDFGFGAREIVVTAPNGEWYRLENTKWDTKQRYDGWSDLKDAIERDIPADLSYLDLRDKARAALAKSKEAKDMERYSHGWTRRKDAGASEEELRRYADKYNEALEKYQAKLKKKIRSVEVRPNHEYLKKHAKEYGFKYTYHNPT